MKPYAIFTLFCLSFSMFLRSEVQTVVITWTPQLCQETCSQGLHKYLSEIPQVARVDINQNAGLAVLTWKPNQPYSFAPIDFATRVIGIPRILSARMRVRGTIQHAQDVFNIISLGDNTVIQLLGPIQPQPGQYTIQKSLYTHPLTTDMKQKLIEFENKRLVVIIDGPIFEPVSLPFSAIIIENIKAEEKDIPS